jgi:hypothetical protein
MMIAVGDGVMTSDITAHTACRPPDGLWEVSWLPGRELTLYEALVALNLAEDAQRSVHERWRKHRVEDWADILRVSPGSAVAACGGPYNPWRGIVPEAGPAGEE